MKRSLAATVLTACLASASSPWAAWVLPPEAAPTVTSVVDIRPTPDGKGYLRSATIDKSTIQVQIRRRGEVVTTVTLVHPSEAPAEAFRAAGVALLEEPGPVDASALAALQRHMKRAASPVPWRELAEEVAEPTEAELAGIERGLVKARYLHSAGDLDEARTTLRGLPDTLPPGVAIRAALLWQRLDSPEAAKAALTGLGAGASAFDAAARAILGAAVEPSATLGDATAKEACAFAELPRILARLNRGEEALALANAIVDRAPDCPEAWEAALHRRHEGGDKAGAAALADKALARFPRDKAPTGLLSVIGATFLAQARFQEAAETLELVARRDPADEGAVRILLSAMLRDAGVRAAQTKRLEAEHAHQPG
ncbi:MAG: hypothetical protein QF464_18340, partial [Myxococcota bacterium]|nr:hypothetical protein [Myxococcota bacterium]